MTTFLVRYGELALKSPPVRREFERVLQRNIVEHFAAAGLACRLRADHGHLYVESDQPDRAVRLLCRVFGVTSVSPVEEVEGDLPRIRERFLPWASPALAPRSTFAIRARRTGQHPFSSQDVARELGALVLQTWPDRGLKVDLGHPEVELSVEVRGPRAYFYVTRSRGPGGFPLGVAGRVVAVVNGTRGALGAYMMMKRGCRTTLAATVGGDDLARRVLARFDPRCRISGPIAGEGFAAEPVRELVAETRADGVVLPLSVEEFPDARQAWGEVVLFSPTVGLTDAEVDGRWREVAELAE